MAMVKDIQLHRFLDPIVEKIEKQNYNVNKSDVYLHYSFEVINLTFGDD